MKSILIAVPTHGGTMHSQTAISLVRVTKALTTKGIDTQIENIDSSDIVLARNMYANSVFASKRWDGLLFVDSDMGFPPTLVTRMIALGVDATAAAYPKRGLDFEQFAASIREGAEIPAARARASKFAVRPIWPERGAWKVSRRGGACTMAAAGMGCSLVSRSLLEQMVEAGVVSRRRDMSNAEGKTSWGFFDHIEAEGMLLAEDYSFWYRWTKLMGRQLWVFIDEEVTHIGRMSYSARYSTLLPGPGEVSSA